VFKMPTTIRTVDGFSLPVTVAGPDKGPCVLLLGAAQHPPAAYDALCKRLHNSAARTAVIGGDPRLQSKNVVEVLDVLEIPSGVLFGDRFGAELAWQVAAAHPERFIGMVVVDRGHPRVPDPHGVTRDTDCPPVEINTTVLVSNPAARAAAMASQRFVYSDFRLVEFGGRAANAEMVTAQMAAEIVLRTSTW
jgi:pimeloyl-ACP methyl ester carboxylesterase